MLVDDNKFYQIIKWVESLIFKSSLQSVRDDVGCLDLLDARQDDVDVDASIRIVRTFRETAIPVLRPSAGLRDDIQDYGAFRA